ncbi:MULTISPECIES: hypothetical protein [Acinetobacter]|uniref:hypothetical protein n=1 Tax=Acinetobacter TaxID=469 RepID=UPI001D170DD6|nr:hypothetical protein [Acinetobacter sp. CIP 101966]
MLHTRAALGSGGEKMKTYSITYDLHQVKNYALLNEGIDKISETVWVKVTLSQFIIKSKYSAIQIRDFLAKHVDNDDVLFITEINLNNKASQNLPTNIADAVNRLK